jgi:riboflavin biosynthesis pyrimidine reductase
MPTIVAKRNHAAIRRTAGNIAPLETLLAARHGRALKLPAALTRLYGQLRQPRARNGVYVFSNFVSTLDGVVSLQKRGHEGGGDISGFSAADRMVMGLLRATADAVIVGSGTLAADSRHVWTPQDICPELGDAYRLLRTALRKQAAPLNVIVSGSGRIDLRLPVFASGRVQTLVVTTATGAKRLRAQSVPQTLDIHAIPRCRLTISPTAILEAVARQVPGTAMLIEGGPRLLGDFYASRLLDEQFLTLAPQVVGREADDGRYSLVMGQVFGPESARWGALIDVRRGGNQLFLRYSFR